MSKKVTINVIAEMARVSKTTVSRFLNGKFDNMSEATKERIAETIAELDYHPSRQAQALKAKNSLLIGISVADISNMYTSRLLKGISDYFQNTIYQVLIMDGDNSIEREYSNLEKMVTERIDGIILQPLVHQPDHYQLLIDENIPVVQVDRYTEPFTWPAVVSDNFQKSLEVADLMKSKNYEEIIVLSNHINGVSSRMNRYNGLKTGIENTNITIKLIEIDDNKDWQNTLQSMLELPTKKALYALNGQVLWEIVRFLKKHHIAIPDDVGVIGYDDDMFADMISPEITSVSQNPQEIGRTAAANLMQIMNDETTLSKTIRIPSTIQMRESL
ncbi:LacI family DNA-binding transcriptional regulator [Leuconostoc suionicum]|uniref:HTH-type transcriptional regulator KdgR n=1 Tax=Leuconostoc suionicum TaxID=1511761 RepID=A0A2N9K9Q4_9LACO|nr:MULTISPECIES: LacI family DNA-binding transcriptional regulator [Leuconostoc]MBE4727247.1 LacI family DNA-binding transcriptional regulator [Leuconostoc suionicum]MCT4402325.1 LacI family DNA-binding transcriptional regulator [Leuconostoc suionicum]MDI6497304.1 LacI family DNA-binding transcriptional regulator [Leuconostoc suionicum]MDI6499386.1 LacI family DNA-binding transcriptional regulator [Leuconostoc suionicum]MDI6501128.1 LacI family DNA-binding transcriptional regulator [Leuconosto